MTKFENKVVSFSRLAHIPVVRKSRQCRFLVLISILAVIFSGCATENAENVDPTRWLVPSPPSEELRAQLSTIQLSKGDVQPTLLITGGVKGKGKGAAIGALAGLVKSLEFPLSAPVMLVWGAVEGFNESEPAVKVEEQEKILRLTMEELNIQETLSLSVSRKINELSLINENITADKPATIILEVVVDKVELKGQGFRLFNFSILERTRLIRASDGTELYRHWLAYVGLPRELNDWLAQDAMKLHEEADRACRELAERIVDEVFFLYLPAGDTGGT
jgi:hypothetical protein